MDSRRRTGSASGSESFYCTNCGEELSPSANFCPDCGTSCETGARTTTRSGSDRDGLEFRVTKAIEDGWEVEHDFGDHVVLLRRSFGSTGTHVLIAFFTIWWTMGIGNALYGAYCYYSKAERRVLWADQATRSKTARDSELGHEASTASSSGSVGTTILLWLGALIMVAAVQSSATILWSVLFGIVALTLALYGTSALPPVRRQLEKRGSITDNGWTRSVRERSVTGSDESCAACAGRVGHGVERTYCKEFAVLGVPVTTTERGTNQYCRRCANGEVPTTTSDSESDSDSHSHSHSSTSTSTHTKPPKHEQKRTREPQRDSNRLDAGRDRDQDLNQDQDQELDEQREQEQSVAREQEQERSHRSERTETKAEPGTSSENPFDEDEDGDGAGDGDEDGDHDDRDHNRNRDRDADREPEYEAGLDAESS